MRDAIQRPHALFIAVFSVVAIGAVAMTERPPPSEPTAHEAPRPSHTYSPFAVRVSGHPAFEVVTFKRVGHDLPHSADASYEEVAESLAHALRERSDLMTEVVHEPALLDPEAHVFCDADHLYVDFWSTTPGWGYSLWSGCGADDRFAWTEFPVAGGDAVAALTAHIINTLDSADAARCYRRAC